MNNTSYEKKFNEAYSRLNPEQKKAVDTIEGPVVVTAGPGTGKTQILTLRIANIIRTQGADTADSILALTFTNSGVLSMRRRLSDFIGAESYRVGIYTFHSFAEHIINTYNHLFQTEKSVTSTAAKDFERISIVESILTENSLPKLKPFADPFFNTRTIISAIDDLKSDDIEPDVFEQYIVKQEAGILSDVSDKAYYYQVGAKKGSLKKDALLAVERNRELLVVYRAYQEAMAEQGLYDFNDMLHWVIKRLEEDSDFLYELQEKYQYLLIDEHQDSNTAQNKIVSLLLSAEHLDGHPNIFTVGDEKQAIYRFQGASQENFGLVKQSYRDVAEIFLETNYRSHQNLLDVAHTLISESHEHSDAQQLTAFNTPSDAPIVRVAELDTYERELAYIGSQIQELVASGVSASDIAILYRKNAHLEGIRDMLAKLSIPSVVHSKQNILLDTDIAKLLVLLRCIVNPQNNHTLGQILFIDFLGVSSHTRVRLFQELMRHDRSTSKQDKKSLHDLMLDEELLQSVGIADAPLLLHIAQVVEELHIASHNTAFNNLFEEVLQKTGFLSHILKSPRSQEKISYTKKLHTEAKKLGSGKHGMTLSGFIDYLDVLERYGIALETKPRVSSEGVQLMTAHGSKGLEFEYVFIVNCVDKVWGGNKQSGYGMKFVIPSTKVQGDDEDERRLFYVSLTRAKKQATVSYSLQDEVERITAPSRFVVRLAEATIEKVDIESLDSVIQEALDTIVASDKQIQSSVIDPAYIQELFSAYPLSVTALNNFIRCPGHYLLSSLLRLPIGYSRSLVYGSVIHTSLEHFFKEAKRNGKIGSSDDLVGIFRSKLDEEYLPNAEYKDMLEEGTKHLSGYFERYHDSFSTEVELEYPVHGVDYHTSGGQSIVLTGKIDMIRPVGSETLDISQNSQVEVVDFKTGKSYSDKSSKQDKSSLERQLAFYKLLLDNYNDGQLHMVNAALDFIQPNKKGEYERYEKQVNEDDLRELGAEIDKLVACVHSESAEWIENRCRETSCESCRLLDMVGE